MTKYFSIFKTSLKQESKTLTNAIVSSISFIVIIYIFYELWSFIYGESGGGTLINGYSLNQMIWYMMMAEVLLSAVNARNTTQNFGNDIKTGKIAYQLNKPYNYFTYNISMTFGVAIWKSTFLIPVALVMGLLLLGPIENFSALYILPIILSWLLAILLTMVIYGGIGLLCFWIEESSPFTWIIQKFQMLLGLFFPPEFFPLWLQPVINYSPVYAMMSGPCKLLAKFSWNEFLWVSVSQISWIAVFLIICIVLYKFGTKKVNVHGG